ncbi:hypothetical protein C8F04DRAFT_1304507, partial [Mycena alexandri]
TAFPRELKRILTDPDITLAGVGLLSDVNVIWEDLRVDMQNLADVGLMAMLLKPEKHANDAFRNLSMDVATQEVLELTIDKGRQKTGLLTGPDAAIDASASLRLFEKLAPALATKEASLGKRIPQGWYTFNSTEGEPTRLEKSFRGSVVGWSTRDCTWFISGKFQEQYCNELKQNI